MFKSNKIKSNSSAFTIVELLVVIVVIGVLAAITIVSYTGITSKAAITSLQLNLTNASKQLKIDQVISAGYPTSLKAANEGKGISSPGVTYQYYADNAANPQTFCLTATKSNQSYNINQDNVMTNGGENIISIDQFRSVTLKSSNSFEASAWATTFLYSPQVLAVFEPSTTYHIKATYKLIAKSDLPVFSTQIGFNLYSSSTGSSMFGITYTLKDVGDIYQLDSSFTTPASLGDKKLVFYSNRYTDGTAVELGRVLVENLKIEKGTRATCWTPGA